MYNGEKRKIMNLVKCEAGHYYDADKSSTCPWCEKKQTLVQEDDTSAYLRKIGLLDYAEKKYHILARLDDGQTFCIPAIGKQKSNDVLQKLIDDGVLNADKVYRFRNWPKADMLAGARYEYENACVCELDVNKVYKIESREMQDIRKLYGAPGCIAVDYGSVFDRIKTEESIKERLLKYYPEMKGIQISGKNSSVAKMLFTPVATKQLFSYFGWGETCADNCGEHIVSLNGFIFDKLIVVEKIVLRNEPERTDCFLELPNTCSLVGMAYIHPFELMSEISINDVPLNVGPQYNNRELVTLVVNPQKKQIAAYRNLDFEQIDVEFLVKNTFELYDFISMEMSEAD